MKLKTFQTTNEVVDFFTSNGFSCEFLFTNILDIIKCKSNKRKKEKLMETFLNIWNSLLRDKRYLKCDFSNCAFLWTIVAKFMKDLEKM
jgi:hypothetical protein